jgi:hypothetical protein
MASSLMACSAVGRGQSGQSGGVMEADLTWFTIQRHGETERLTAKLLGTIG